MWAVATRFHKLTNWRSVCRVRVYVRWGCLGGAVARLFLLTVMLVYLVWLLLACGDVEANPGPWTQSDQGSHHEQCPEDLNDKLFSLAGYLYQDNQQPEHLTTAPETRPLPDAMYRLEEWCQSLQEENNWLNHNMNVIHNKCNILVQECENLYQWKELFVDVSEAMDAQVDKLESFSRRNNVRFFNVYEGPNEDSVRCAHKVVQLLNIYFPNKTWSIDDIERAHRTGPRSNNYERPRLIMARLHRWYDKMSILQTVPEERWRTVSTSALPLT